jgi:peptide/nickel transport system substrate-binding protein
LRRIVAFVTCAALLLGGGCSRSGSTASAPSDTLTISVPITPITLNPILANGVYEVLIDELIFPKLVTINDRHEEVPILATEVPTLQNHGISADNRTITYHLRHDAKWSDGKPVTSADVAYTTKQLLNPANNVVSRNGFDRITSIETPDAYTVVVHLKEAFPPFLDAYFGESDSPYGILPQHVLAQYPNLNQIPFDSEPSVTCGPYRFAQWIRGDRIVLTADPNYYLGAASIKTLVIKPIADTNTVLAQLRTGEVQLALGLTGPQYHQISSDANLAHSAVEQPAYDSIVFNTSRAPMNDIVVRQALAYATDREALSRDNEYGNATTGAGDLGPFSWAYDPSAKAQPFDPAKARSLLDADGWKPGSDGIRVKNGVRLSLLFVYGQGSDVARNVVVQVQQMWRNVGVEIQPKSFPYAQLNAQASDGGIYYGGKFDTGLYAWLSGTDPDSSSQLISSQIPPAGNNIARYRSAAMDDAQRLALSTFDRGVRKRAYAQITRLEIQDVPELYLFYPRMNSAFTPALKNYRPNGVTHAWNANTWTLSTP